MARRRRRGGFGSAITKALNRAAKKMLTASFKKALRIRFR